MTALVRVEDLAKTFDVSAPWLNRVIERKPRQFVHAVDGVSFTIHKGKTLALVGESGCGKSTVARLLVGLYEPTRGAVFFDGQDTGVLKSSAANLRGLRRRMQMIFQDPYASLNPRWKVLDIVGEPLREHGLFSDTAGLPSGRDARSPGQTDDERDAADLVVDRGGVELAAVLAELLAVIAVQDDDRVVPQAARAELLHEPPELGIDRTELAVIARGGSSSGRSVVTSHVGRVRIHVVQPQEERPARVSMGQEVDRRRGERLRRDPLVIDVVLAVGLLVDELEAVDQAGGREIEHVRDRRRGLVAGLRKELGQRGRRVVHGDGRDLLEVGRVQDEGIVVGVRLEAERTIDRDLRVAERRGVPGRERRPHGADRPAAR